MVSPEPVKTLGTKNTPSKNAGAYLSGIRNKIDSNSSEEFKNSTAPSHEHRSPMQTDGFPPAPVPSANLQNPLTASTPAPPASTTGDAERPLLQTGFEGGFPKRPAGTAETQDSTGSGRPHRSPDVTSSETEATDSQSFGGRCADVLAFDGAAQSDPAPRPAHTDGTFLQADNTVTHAPRELSMSDSVSTQPGSGRDVAVIGESTPSRLNEDWKQAGEHVPPSDLRFSIKGQHHEVHAIGAHTAAKEKSQAEPGCR